MAWPTLRTFKDASANTRQAIIGTTATAGEDKPLYNPVYGADGADPSVVTVSSGLPVQPYRLVGGPTTYAKIAPSSAAITGNGNSVAVGGTGGTAVPGMFLVQANPDNANVIAIGDTSVSAFTGGSSTTSEARGFILAPGDAMPLIHTDDLRAWKVSARTLGDSVIVTKVG